MSSEVKLCAMHGMYAKKGCADCDADIDMLTELEPPDLAGEGQCSPGDPAPPPSTPAQHYLAEINGCASQEWQDGYNAAVLRLVLPQPKPRPRLGRCGHLQQAGGCPRHNLQCGYPKCDEYPMEPQP